MYNIFLIKRDVRYPDGSFRSTPNDDLFFYKTETDMNRGWSKLNMKPVPGSSLCSNHRSFIEMDATRRPETIYGFIMELEFDDNDFYWTTEDGLFIFNTKEERDETYDEMNSPGVRLTKFDKPYSTLKSTF